jgi:hypothetical protein
MLEIPTYWVRPPQILSAAAGTHRFLWDMHYPPVPGIKPEYPIAAIPHNTAPQPTSPWVMPGEYTVVLSVNGKTYSQPLTIKMDPRVKTPNAGLSQQFKLSQQMYNGLRIVVPASDQVDAVRKQLTDIRPKLAEHSELLTAVNDLDQKLQALAGGVTRRPGPGTEPPNLGNTRTRLLAMLGFLQEADEAPTTQMTGAVGELDPSVKPLISRWQEIKGKEIEELNKKLHDANLPELKVE